jgi:hypothetical protein
MLEYFFENAKGVVNSPIRDKTGQSIHVDDYLGAANSELRFKAGYALEKISRRMKDADLIGSDDDWRSILGV